MIRLHGGMRRLLALAGLLTILLPLRTLAQAPPDDGSTPINPAGGISIHVGLGTQSMWINGDVPARQEISPGEASNLPLGGGITGTSPGIHLQAEILPHPDPMFRIPVSFDAFFLSGKTTFVTSQRPKPVERLLLDHTANLFSLGTGVMVSIVRTPNIYVSGEAKLNYVPPTQLLARRYKAINDSTISEVILHPDTSSQVRIGAYIKAGVQVEFFEPLMLDFNIGYGAINLLGKDTNPATRRNLLIVDSQLHDPELTIGYIGVGFAVIWKF